MTTTNLSAKSAAIRLIENLVENGIDHFFGIPGGPAAPIFEAIRITPGAQLIESRQETHAMFSAVNFYKKSGKMAVVVTTSGPGITNAATGIVNADQERVPVLVISGDVPWCSSGSRLTQDSGPQGIGIEQLYSHVTRKIERIYNPNSVVSQAYSAISAANEPHHKGPSILVLPIDKAFEESNYYNGQLTYSYKHFVTSENTFEKIVGLFSNARNPLIVIGGACFEAKKVVHELVDKLKLPFITTPRAKGLISEYHPQSLRNGGLAACLWARTYTARDIDVCLVLGTDLDDSSTACTRYVGNSGKLIHVDINQHILNRNIPCEVAVHSDIESFCTQFLNYIDKQKNIKLPDMSRVLEDIKSQSPVQDLSKQHERLDPTMATVKLQEAMPKRCNIVSDIGGHMLFAYHYLVIPQETDFIINFNLGSMGSGIAGAIGAAVADPTLPTLCIAGDGGMQMAGMEALVAKVRDLPIVYAVYNDSRYNIVHHGMKQIFGDACKYETPETDFKTWAESLGIAGVTINKLDEITPILLKEITQNFTKPCILDLKVNPDIIIQAGRVEALQQMSMTNKL